MRNLDDWKKLVNTKTKGRLSTLGMYKTVYIYKSQFVPHTRNSV